MARISLAGFTGEASLPKGRLNHLVAIASKGPGNIVIPQVAQQFGSCSIDDETGVGACCVLIVDFESGSNEAKCFHVIRP